MKRMTAALVTGLILLSDASGFAQPSVLAAAALARKKSEEAEAIQRLKYVAKPVLPVVKSLSIVPDRLDQLLEPFVMADLEERKSLWQQRVHLFSFLGLDFVGRFRSTMETLGQVVSQIPPYQRPSGELQDVGLAVSLFWQYATIRLRLQPESKWTPLVDFILQRSLFRITQCFVFSWKPLLFDDQVELLARVLLTSPAAQTDPQGFNKLLTSVKKEDFVRFDYESRQEAIRSRPLHVTDDPSAYALYPYIGAMTAPTLLAGALAGALVSLGVHQVDLLLARSRAARDEKDRREYVRHLETLLWAQFDEARDVAIKNCQELF